MIITIDGPVGSGKSSVAKKLAEALQFYYLNTGLLYRAVAYILTQKMNLNKEEFSKLGEMDLGFINNIYYKYVKGIPQVFYRSENITAYLYDNTLSQLASIISSKREVRSALLCLERSVAKKYNIVAEGRDCGTVVFPNADYKFYLTATVDVRAKRIFEDQKRRSDTQIDTFEYVKAELITRDERDKTREVAPLVVPEDAFIVDSSSLSENKVVQRLLELIEFVQ